MKDSEVSVVMVPMRSSRWIPTVVGMLALAAAIGGCGSEGGEDPARTPALSGTPTPTAPPATTAPTPFPEVLLAVGRSFAALGNSDTPLILRNREGDWQGVSVGTPPLAVLTGVVFSASDVAWAFGFAGDYDSPVLLQSQDAGTTWTDVRDTLPMEVDGIADMTFADSSTGYLVARGLFRPRMVFRTVDGGASWERIEAFTSGALPGTYALATRGTAAELLSYDTDGTLVRRLDDLAVAPVVLDGVAFIGGPNAFTSVGERGWIVFSGLNFPNDFARTRAAITASAAPGRPWIEQPVALAAFADMRAIDVRDDQSAVAGGATVSDSGYAPLALLLNQDGASWGTAPITGIPEGWLIVDVVRARGEAAWAIATDITTGNAESAFLRSDDGGRSWHRAPTQFDHGTQLFDLTRNTAAR